MVAILSFGARRGPEDEDDDEDDEDDNHDEEEDDDDYHDDDEGNGSAIVGLLGTELSESRTTASIRGPRP